MVHREEPNLVCERVWHVVLFKELNQIGPLDSKVASGRAKCLELALFNPVLNGCDIRGANFCGFECCENRLFEVHGHTLFLELTTFDATNDHLDAKKEVGFNAGRSNHQAVQTLLRGQGH